MEVKKCLSFIGTKKDENILIVLLVLLISGGVILWKNMPYRFLTVLSQVLSLWEKNWEQHRKQIEEMMAAKLVEWHAILLMRFIALWTITLFRKSGAIQ